MTPKRPWERPNPKERSGKPSRPLSAAEKASAKRHAKEAGRPYPNLVDNMRAAAKSGPRRSRRGAKEG